MHKLDRILDGEDVAFFAPVDVIDHGGQRRGFAGSGLAGHQNQAAVDLAHVHHSRRELQFLGGLGAGRNGPEHRAHAVELTHDVDAKTRHAGDGVGEVGAVFFFEALDRQLRHDFVQRGLDESALSG